VAGDFDPAVRGVALVLLDAEEPADGSGVEYVYDLERLAEPDGLLDSPDREVLLAALTC
jgi:hypothetical protein